MLKIKSILKLSVTIVVLGLIAGGVYFVYDYVTKFERENRILKEIVERLSADSRIAEAMVVDVNFDPLLSKHKTTIKFLEYDSKGRPLTPRFFAFFGNIIQFQSLVVRFDDAYVKNGDALRGKSAYLFWKVFFLDGANTLEYEISKVKTVPAGYQLEGNPSSFEVGFWQRFWEYALDPKIAHSNGIKNAQIEAPGTKFLPGMIYTIKIEHDGGIRIDAAPIPEILRGEKIPVK